MSSLYTKFMDKTLTKQHIIEWLKKQGLIRYLLEKEVLTEEQLEHIATCLHHIYRWYWENLPIGHFLTAVLENNFVEASLRADRTNQIVLPIYAVFLYNAVPMDYRTKLCMMH